MRLLTYSFSCHLSERVCGGGVAGTSVASSTLATFPINLLQKGPRARRGEPQSRLPVFCPWVSNAAPWAATAAPKLPHQGLPVGGSDTLARGRATPKLSLLLIFPNWVESQAKQLQGDHAGDHSRGSKGTLTHAYSSTAPILNLEAEPAPES